MAGTPAATNKRLIALSGGKIAVTGRYHASLNPNAYLKKPITIDDYKKSRLISDPIRLLDCVLPANGFLVFQAVR